MSSETYRQQREREAAEYDAWINALQPGDDVFVDDGGHYSVGVIRRVKKLTRTQVVLEHERPGCEGRFRKDTGTMRTGSLRWPAYSTLRPVTQAVRDKLEKHALAEHLRAVNWGSMTLAQLRAAKLATTAGGGT